METPGDSTYLTREDLAHRWNMTPGALRSYLHRHGGPTETRFGRTRRYRLADVHTYETSLRDHQVST